MGRPKKIKAIEENTLTEKQEKFCQAYIEFGNKSEAYRQAYDADAMNTNSVRVAANEVFNVPNVSLRIAELQKELRERNKVKIDDVLGYLADMIKFDIAEVYDENGKMKSIHDIPKPHREMISSVKVYQDFLNIDGQKELIGETKEVRILNKLDVIEKFMKHFGAYEKDNQQKKSEVTINLSELTTEELIDRAKAIKKLNE